MDTRATDREVIEKVLTEYASVPYAHGQVETQTVFDRLGNHYLLMIVGSEGKRRRVHGCLVHIDIKDDLVLIQRDGTEHGMAPDLARAGIPPERIVLAFHPTGARPYSEFLAA
jgi:hypothetical protein